MHFLLTYCVLTTSPSGPCFVIISFAFCIIYPPRGDNSIPPHNYAVLSFSALTCLFFCLVCLLFPFCRPPPLKLASLRFKSLCFFYQTIWDDLPSFHVFDFWAIFAQFPPLFLNSVSLTPLVSHRIFPKMIITVIPPGRIYPP